MRRLGAVALAAVLAMSLWGTALAAKGGNGGGGGGKNATGPTATITLDQAGQPLAIGSVVTFSVTYPPNVNNPLVEVLCFQGGVLVYGASGVPGTSFLLGGASSPWLATGGGPASCEGDLFRYSWSGGTTYAVMLASTPFAVS